MARYIGFFEFPDDPSEARAVQFIIASRIVTSRGTAKMQKMFEFEKVGVTLEDASLKGTLERGSVVDHETQHIFRMLLKEAVRRAYAKPVSPQTPGAPPESRDRQVLRGVQEYASLIEDDIEDELIPTLRALESSYETFEKMKYEYVRKFIWRQKMTIKEDRAGLDRNDERKTLLKEVAKIVRSRKFRDALLEETKAASESFGRVSTTVGKDVATAAFVYERLHKWPRLAELLVGPVANREKNGEWGVPWFWLFTRF